MAIEVISVESYVILVRLNLMDSGFENRRQLFPGVNVKKIIDMNVCYIEIDNFPIRIILLR